MAEWQRQTIGELIARGALTMSDGYRTKRSEHGQPGFRIIRVADVGDGTVALDSPDFVSEMYRSQIGAKIGEAGDILLTTKGTVGRVAILPTVGEPVVYSPQLCFFRVASDGPLVRDYLRFWLRSAEFWAQARDRMNNTDMAAYINLADVRSLEVTLPPLTEQRAIAEVLGALDDKIAANTRLATTADALAASTLRASLSGEVAPLVELATVTMGSSPPGASYNETGDGIPFFQGVRDFGLRFPRSRVWTTSPVRFARRGDTLLSVRAPVGRVNVASDDLCVGRGLASVRSTHGRPWSLFHLLRDAPGVWAPYEAEGTVFGSINRDQLSGLLLPTVAARDADKVERTIAGLEARLGSALAENATLAATRNALLPALMSGKLRVREAERLVEGVT